MNAARNGLFLFLVFIFALTGCERKERMEILASKIQYDVPVFSDNPQLEWWINNLEGSRRDPFTQRLLEVAEKGEMRAFDYFNNPLTPGEIKAVLVDTIYKTLTRTVEPYEEYDTVIYLRLDHRDITKVRFLEEWRWDPESFEMEKQVLGIAPVVVIEYEGREYNRPLFWIYLEEGYPEQ